MPLDVTVENFPFVIPPWKHQGRAFKRFAGKRFAALLWQMRTGKTKAAIDLTAFYRARTGCRLVFVLAPNGVHENWTRVEFPKHWPPEMGELLMFHWNSADANGNKTRQETHAAAIRAVLSHIEKDKGVAVVAINSEGLISNKVERVIKRLLRAVKPGEAAGLFDESDDFKAPGSRRSRRARSLAKRCGLRIIMTGTMTPKSPLDAWSQFELLKKGLLGHEKFGTFEEHYAVYEASYGRGGKKFPKLSGYKNEEELQALMAPHSDVVLRSDCEDLPEIVPGSVFVRMSPRQEELYHKLRIRFKMEMASGEYSVLDAAVRVCRLQQILSNRLISEEGEVEVADPDVHPRLEALLDWAGRQTGQFIVWCRFTQDVEELCAALSTELGMKVARFDGPNKPNREKELAEFQAGERFALVGQPGAGGRGRDMGRADTVAWYSHTYNLRDRLQAGERATVMGKLCVGLTDFVCPDSVDERALAVLSDRVGMMDVFSGRGLQAACRDLFGDG